MSNYAYTQFMKYTLLFLMLFGGLYVHAQSPIVVKVGMYPFAPFVESLEDGDDDDAVVGMSVDLMNALNRIQNTYIFEPVVIPPKRRYQSYAEGHYDVIFYENKAWGWGDTHIDASKVFQVGKEVYVALNKPGRTQEYFEILSDKRMIGIAGFHYGFANFDADEDHLANTFNMALTSNNARSFNLLLKERGDVVVMTNAYVQHRIFKNPELKAQLLISEKVDQKYQHTVMLRPKIRPSMKEINYFLDLLQVSGELDKIRDQYNIHN